MIMLVSSDNKKTRLDSGMYIEVEAKQVEDNTLKQNMDEKGIKPKA